MKKIGTILLFITLIFSFQIDIKAQEEEEDDDIQTLFDGKVDRVSGFGGPFMSFSTLDGDFAHFMGGGGGVLLNNRFFFGGYGYGLTTRMTSKSDAYEGMKIEFGNGGFWFGGIMKPNKVFHLSYGLKTGWGEAQIIDDYNDVVDVEDKIFVVTPNIELEMNVTRFMKIGAGIDYRLVLGIDDLAGYDNMSFSSPGACLSFKFGWF